MKVIGITGGIGSGKSVVSKVFNVLGVPVYDSDTEAKLLINTSEVLRIAIVELLGKGSYNELGYNRAYVSKAVFNDSVLLKKLNEIVHPAVAKHFEDWKNEQSSKVVAKESAILFQTGIYKHLDYTVLVWADESIRIKRIKARDQNRSLEQIKAILTKQGDWNKMKPLANFIVNNNGDRMLIPQVKKVLNKVA